MDDFQKNKNERYRGYEERVSGNFLTGGGSRNSGTNGRRGRSRRASAGQRGGSSDVSFQRPPQGAPRQGAAGAPGQGTPQQGRPQGGQQRRPQGSYPQQGAPRQGAPRQGAPRQGAPRQSAPQQGRPQGGQQRRPQGRYPQQGAPRQGAPRQGAPRQGAPRQGAPQQRRPQGGQQRRPQGNYPQRGYANAQARPQNGYRAAPQGAAAGGYGGTPPYGPDNRQIARRKNGKPKKRFRDNFPQKGDSTGEIIRKIIVLVSAVVLIGCLVYFAYTGIMAGRNSSTTSKLSEMLNADEKADWAEIHQKYPNVDFPEGMQIKFASLYAQNQDLVGWVKIPGLDIDFPVMQTQDDTFYLRHNFNKEYTVYGCPFLSHFDSIKDLEQNSTIYAHSMRRDDQMFTKLKAYRSVDGFKENPIIEFDTLYKDYYFKVYAVYISNGNAEDDNGYLFDYTWHVFPTKQNFVEYVNQINQRKLYSTGVDISTSDKLLTLSTCTYDFDDARLVVVGRLVRPGESKRVNTRHTKMNPNPRFPQAWYDAKGQTNPYANAPRWRAMNEPS